MGIINMSARELVQYGYLLPLAEEAIRSSNIIHEYFSKWFESGDKELHVFNTEFCGKYFGEGYLTSDGVFKYYDNWQGGRSIFLDCSEDGIYKMLRSCYSLRHRLPLLDPEFFSYQIENFDEILRNFIKGIEPNNAAESMENVFYDSSLE